MVSVKKIEIGSGRPKICAPIVGRTDAEMEAMARNIGGMSSVDVAEWRIDWYESVKEPEQLRACGENVKKALADKPILVTFRTAAEGGECAVTDLEYKDIYMGLIEAGIPDLLDLELFRDAAVTSELIRACQEKGIPVVMSNHDFDKTPAREEIIRRLQMMDQAGADILKIAVMPQSMSDVLTLLSATEEMSRMTTKPLITMSMGRLGMISRLSGQCFGSALTFGSAGKASAPGQIGADDLKTVLEIIAKGV